DVAVRVQVVAAQHVVHGVRRREDDHGHAPQLRIELDLRQELATVLARQIEIEDHEVRAPRGPVGRPALQERDRLLAVVHPDDPASGTPATAIGSPATAIGNVNMNSLPWPAVERAQIRPRWRSTIFLQIASPTPVPAYSSRVWSRWNATKMRSRCFGSMPMPL